MTKRIFPPEVCLLPHSDGVQTLHLNLVHPDDVVDAGVENDDANLPSEVGLELPEEYAAVETVQGGFRATTLPDLAWCDSASSCTDVSVPVFARPRLLSPNFSQHLTEMDKRLNWPTFQPTYLVCTCQVAQYNYT